jgi:poly(3-hydroxybutyrate) depolymerase
VLYNLYETQRSLMEPFTDLAQSAAKLFANPLSPVGQHPLAQRVSAAYDLMHRLGKDYVKPEFGIKTVEVDGVEVAIYERVEIKKPFCELRRFKRFTDDLDTLTKLKDQPAVLIVAPLSGHYATLLRDTVQTMLKDHKVYITEWTNARLVPTSEGDFDLSDYVNYVQEFIRHVQELYGNCHVMSVCQPTVPVLAAVSLMASRGEPTPLSMVMMGGPIDAQRSPTKVNNLAMNKSLQWFENNVIYRVPSHFPGAGRRVYPGFLQHTGFVVMNPGNHMRSHYDYFKDLVRGDGASAEAHRKFYDEYNAVLDMDAAFYLETIRVVFQDFCLINHNWNVRNPDGALERVRPQDIRGTALLSVEGELDDISGSGQTAAVHDLCTGVEAAHKQHVEVAGAGHYGIFAGRRWREVVYPKIKAFISQYQPSPDQVHKSNAEQQSDQAQALQVAIASLHTPKSKATVVRQKAAGKKVSPAIAKPAAKPAPSQAATTAKTNAAPKLAKSTARSTKHSESARGK